MAGGLLNLVASGSQNVILNGNPEKTFWTSTYKRYSNFGLQNFRLDFEGLRQLSLTSETTFTFKVRRYADLLCDMFFVIQMPAIYSPIAPPVDPLVGTWAPYEFKWIKNLGAMMINTVNITIGGALIQSITGYQMVALANRDFSAGQKAKWDAAIGNVPEMYNPNVDGKYPNSVYSETSANPSIPARTLYVPLPVWWGLNSQQAFPLVSLQYNEMQIEITVRPIKELFQIRDLVTKNYIAPNFNLSEYKFNRFLVPPLNVSLDYGTSGNTWNENVHLSCTYCFLSEEECSVFAQSSHNFLVKQLYETTFYNVKVNDKVWLQNSTGLVASWMIMFQRADVNERNEWSNFTTWAYGGVQQELVKLPFILAEGTSPINEGYTVATPTEVITIPAGKLGYGFNPNGTENSVYSTGAAAVQKNILQSLSIILDGANREENCPVGFFEHQQQFLSSSGFGGATLPGLFCYNFCLNTSPFSLQPSGAINMSKFSKVELEFTTVEPPSSESAYYVICDADTNAQIGTTKTSGSIYQYTFNLYVIEERYNVITFMGGNAALMMAR